MAEIYIKGAKRKNAFLRRQKCVFLLLWFPGHLKTGQTGCFPPLCVATGRCGKERYSYQSLWVPVPAG